MSTSNPLASLIDPSQPAGNPLPLVGGPAGGAMVPNSLLFSVLLEMRVANYYAHCMAAGILVSAQDDPDNVRNQMLNEPAFVKFS